MSRALGTGHTDPLLYTFAVLDNVCVRRRGAPVGGSAGCMSMQLGLQEFQECMITQLLYVAFAWTLIAWSPRQMAM